MKACLLQDAAGCDLGGSVRPGMRDDVSAKPQLELRRLLELPGLKNRIRKLYQVTSNIVN